MTGRTRALLRSPLWLELAVVLSWVALTVFVYTRYTATGAPSSSSSTGMALLTAAGEGPGAEWIEVSLQGQKIGCGLSDTVKLKDGYRRQERIFLRLRAFEQDKEITTVFVANTDLSHRLKQFNFMLNAPPSQIDIRGEVRGNRLELEIHTGGEIRRQEIPLEQVPDISLTFKERVLEKNPQVGEVIEVSYFDPASLAQQKMEVKVVGKGEATVDGKSVPTYTLEASYHGFKTTAVVTADGRTLEETNALGMKLTRTSREKAIHEGWPGNRAPVDVIALSAVPLKEPIENARATRYLEARLMGGGVEVLLGRPEDGGRAGQVKIEVPERSRWRSYQIPLIDARFERELSATPLIQKDDPKVIQVAQSIIGDTLKADEAAALLSSWVHDRLQKTPVMGVPSALDILKMGAGDCNEHTTLFTALARAVGIPTRMAAGIVYSDQIGSGPAFYYHAWPEVYLGEWVAVDPTFGQFPADATHIKLVEGDLHDQLALLRVVGNLQIDVREYR